MAALHRLAVAEGVQFRLEQKVTEIYVDDAGVQGVKMVNRQGIPSGQFANVVVSNADIQHTEMKLLPPKFRSYDQSYFAQRNPSISAILVESFLMAGIVMSVIFLSMKFMDKRQFAIDFFAVTFALYYIAKPILSSIFSNFDIFLEPINTVTMTLFFDILIAMSVIIIIYTFRQKFDNTIVKINILAITLFLILDIVFVYQDIVGIYTEDEFFDFFYIIPHVLFSISISIESSLGGFSYKLRDRKSVV